MAIQNVNGRNVYVLAPKEPTGKTTSGKNWATLYSDLRWQVWEQQQKNEETKMQLELKGFQAQKEYYDQQKKFLQSQIGELQKIKARTGTEGGISIAEGLRAAEALAPKSVGGGTPKGAMRTIKTETANIFGRPIPGSQPIVTTSTTFPLRPGDEGYVPPVGGGRTIIQPEGEVKTFLESVVEGAKPGAKGDTKSIDEQIAQLEKELAGLTAPQLNMETDLLARTQRGFERNVGVMGQGGGAFGLAPRPRRTLPRVDQALAQQRIDELAATAGAEQADRDKLSKEKTALLSRKTELEALGLGPMQKQQVSQEIDDRINAINEALSAPTMVEQAIGSETFIPRRAGELLLKTPPGGIPELPSPELPEATPQEEPPFTYQQPDRFPRERTRPDLAFLLEGMNVNEAQPTRPPSGMEQVPESLEGWSPELGLPVKGPTTAPAPQPEPAPSPEPRMEPGATDGATAPVITEDLVKKAREYFKGMSVSELGGDPTDLKKVRSPERYFGSEEEMVKEYLKEQKRQETPVGAPPQAKKTSRQRKDLYAISVVSEGVKLAEKPKKLERLAKTQAEESKRPSHIAIVDRLYETNKGKANAFKATYDEISRVFADEPAKRKEAHTYLVAKDTLEQNKMEPLA